MFSKIFEMSILLQAKPDVDFISQLYNLSPIIGLLLIAIGYLVYDLRLKNKKIEEKEGELKELNKYVRESENENIKILEKVSNTLDKVVDSQRSGDNSVLKEIDNLKQLIILKLKND